MHARGYMVEVDLDESTLRARGTTKAARIALAGEDHAAGDVVIPLTEIASVQLKPANMLVNGNLIVRTRDGRKVQMHYRRKSRAEFTALHEALARATS